MSLLLIANGTVIDGNGGPPLSDAEVLIENNQIRAVGRVGSLPTPNAELTHIDAGGGFILPGFIDAHVHLWHDDFDVMREMTDPLSLNFYRAVGNMRATIEAGVTTVRDALAATWA